MTLTRRALITRSTALAVALDTVRGWPLAGVAHAADVTWRMATKQPPDSNEGKSFQRFADKVKEFSGGRMEVRVYPNEQLGKTEAVLEQIQAGTVHLYPDLVHLGLDPNWRRRLSVLDQLRGGQIEPGRPWKAYAASLRPHTVPSTKHASSS